MVGMVAMCAKIQQITVCAMLLNVMRSFCKLCAPFPRISVTQFGHLNEQAIKLTRTKMKMVIHSAKVNCYSNSSDSSHRRRGVTLQLLHACYWWRLVATKTLRLVYSA